MTSNMKKIIMSLIILFMVVAMAMVVQAEPGDTASNLMIFTWTANTESDLAGYKIYYDKEFLVAVPDPVAVSFTYCVENLHGGDNVFNMTAYDTSGNESALSADAGFFYDSLSPAIPTDIVIKNAAKTRVTIETWE